MIRTPYSPLVDTCNHMVVSPSLLLVLRVRSATCTRGQIIPTYSLGYILPHNQTGGKPPPPALVDNMNEVRAGFQPARTSFMLSTIFFPLQFVVSPYQMASNHILHR